MTGSRTHADDTSARAVPVPDQNSISAALAEAGTLDVHDLRVAWRKRFHQSPPHLPKALLWRMFAYRLQASALGDLDRESIRFLDALARQAGRKTQRGPAGAGPQQGPSQGRRRADARARRSAASRRGDRGRLCLERDHLRQLVRGRARDHRHALERTSLLRAEATEGGRP
jgi:hypothetical protein